MATIANIKYRGLCNRISKHSSPKKTVWLGYNNVPVYVEQFEYFHTIIYLITIIIIHKRKKHDV